MTQTVNSPSCGLSSAFDPPYESSAGSLIVVDTFRIVSERGRHERGLHGFDPDFDIEGLGHALAHPTLEKAEFLWRLLLQYESSVRGEVEKSTRQNWDGSRVTRELSTAGELLVKSEWLPDRDGSFRRPSELTLDDLPDGFLATKPLPARSAWPPWRRARKSLVLLESKPRTSQFCSRTKRSSPDFVGEDTRAHRAERRSGARERARPLPTTLRSGRRTGGADVALDAPLPVAGPRTREHAHAAVEDSRETSKDSRVEERDRVRRVLSKEAAEQQPEGERRASSRLRRPLSGL